MPGKKGKTYQLSRKMSELAEVVKEVFFLHLRRYGARRISAELKAEGLAVRHRLAGALMKQQSLTAIRPRADCRAQLIQSMTTDIARIY